MVLAVRGQAPPARFPTRVSVTEFLLRKYATKSTLPAFPRSSIKRNSQGVAVCQVTVNAQGNVTEVTVWEAPDSEIAKAVTRAIRKWIFKAPTISGKSVPINGKLTFYFEIQNGRGIVRNPKPFEQ